MAGLVALVVSGICAASASAASITLVSGDGTAGSPDPNVTVTDSCVGTPSQATIVPAYGAWTSPISGTQWDSPNAGYYGCNGNYQTSFTLPAGAVGSSVTVSDLADNSANVSLNAGSSFITGNVPVQCEAAFDGPPLSGSTTTGFATGANTLTFDVDNCYPAEGESPTGVDFVANATYGTAGASVPSLAASYSGTASNTTDNVNGDLTLTGVTESPQGQISGDATFDSGLVGGGRFVGTVSGSSIDLTIVSATPNDCVDDGCVMSVLSGTVGSTGTLSGTSVIYTGSGSSQQGVWQVSPGAAPTSITTAVAVSNPVAGATGVDYTADLTASSSGTLASGSGTITIAFPLGTGIPACSQITLTDLSSGDSAGPSACSSSDGLVAMTVPFSVTGGDQLQVALAGVTNTTATGTQTVEISTSADDAGTATYTLATGGALSGTVQYETSSGVEPVTGSVVQACDGTNCYPSTTETPGDGSYSFQLPVGTYTVTAFAPTSDAYSLGDGSTGSVDITAGQSTTADVTLPSIAPLPSGVTFNGESGTVGIVYWGSPAPLTVQGCQGGIGAVLVSSMDWLTEADNITFAGLKETAPDSGVYTTTIPALYPSHGTGIVDSVVECPPATALAPASGPVGGGNTVQISGSGFTGATAVMFGTTPASSFTVVSDSEIDAVAPPGTGVVTVTVATPAGTIGSATLGQYTYLTVGTVTPSSGSATGGTDVTITGSGFSNVQAVYFGDKTATDVQIVSDTEITAIAPPGTGSAPVTVITVDGGESSPTDGSFTYDTPTGSTTSTQQPNRQTADLGASASQAATQLLGLLAQRMFASSAGPASDPFDELPGSLEAVKSSLEVAKTAGEVLEHAG